MDLQKAMEILSYIGAVAVGMPVMLHALVVFFKLIPGDQPDKVLDQIQGFSQKFADLVSKIYPQKPAQ